MSKLEGGDLGNALSPASVELRKARDKLKNELAEAKEDLLLAKEAALATASQVEDCSRAGRDHRPNFT